MAEVRYKNGRGLDIGTGFLVMSRMTEEGDVETKSVRDSFLEITTPNKMVTSTMRKSLLKSGINFFEEEGTNKLIILGQDSLEKSVERQAILKRPMSKGVISPSEENALPMFKALLRELLGPPQVENEKILFTVPAAPVDGDFDVIYHEAVISSILRDLGYEGSAINEAYAIILSELDEENYTGISISMGSGMTNVAIADVAELIVKFSVAKGGDYVDQGTALSLGFDHKSPVNKITPNLVTFVKEAGVDILNPDPTDRIQIGISAHYKDLINYVVDNIVYKLSNIDNVPNFLQPITIILAGGTSLAPGVVEVFCKKIEEVKDQLPFKVKEIRHSKKALTSVAEGCLLSLHSEDD